MVMDSGVLVGGICVVNVPALTHPSNGSTAEQPEAKMWVGIEEAVDEEICDVIVQVDAAMRSGKRLAYAGGWPSTCDKSIA